MSKTLLHIIKLLPFKGKKFYGFIWSLTGIRPKRMDVYRLAFAHKSAMQKSKRKELLNNERLEFLGDAVLGAVVAEELYNKFPHKNEGFLTKTRSRIVNRSLLNNIALQMHLDKWVKTQAQIDVAHTSILGDALEALIGALYVDRGYGACRRFITRRLIPKYINLQRVARKDTNYKSLLIEWGQKNKADVQFITEEQHDADGLATRFHAKILVNENYSGQGEGLSKKEAQQHAAHQALLKIDTP
ncbi:ribonuclease III [Carboxylicivirga sp. N1Y90]|uniref:ribonuclease III n=1 Tax=Carboxylicivirga fragile TaxID=3417571 RepID=UPI003D32DA0D